MAAPSKRAVDYTTLGIKVEALEGDVREVKDSIVGLDAKIEKSISSLAHEMRTTLAALTGQFNDRQRTPWAVLIAAAGFIVAVLGVVGSQALTPIQSEVKYFRETLVARTELDGKWELSKNDREQMRRELNELRSRQYDNAVREIQRLEQENRDFRSEVRKRLGQ